jgi:hypothetical protein
MQFVEIRALPRRDGRVAGYRRVGDKKHTVPKYPAYAIGHDERFVICRAKAFNVIFIDEWTNCQGGSKQFSRTDTTHDSREFCESVMA